MQKLRIKFWQVENVVIMKVLNQDEKLRNKGELFNNDNLEMIICSNDYPAMLSDGLFIRGNLKERDNLACNYTFSSTKAASLYIEKCQELISGYNNTILDEEEEEVVKTFIFE